MTPDEITTLYSDKLVPGQLWRKRGPWGWLKIIRIEEPGQPGYDGGLPGAIVAELPPQSQPRGRTRWCFIPGDWREQLTRNRFPVGAEAEQPSDGAYPDIWMPKEGD